MIRRNVKIQELELGHCGLDAETCKRICGAVVDNRHLVELWINDQFSPQADTFVLALSGKSALTNLEVEARWTVEAFASFVECLKTNVVLESMDFRFSDDPHNIPFELIEDMLSTHNCTVQQVSIHTSIHRSLIPRQDSIDALMRSKGSREGRRGSP